MTDLNPNVMTELNENDEILIERLVDDELSEQERQDLLLRLDETLDGWRYCALSFLEAQAFRDALKPQRDKNAKLSAIGVKALAQDSPAANELFASVNNEKKSDNASLRRMKTLAAIAAGIMLGAVCVGYFQPRDTASTDTSFAVQKKAATESTVNTQLAADDPVSEEQDELLANNADFPTRRGATLGKMSPEQIQPPPVLTEKVNDEQTMSALAMNKFDAPTARTENLNDQRAMSALAMDDEKPKARTFAAKVANAPNLLSEHDVSPVKTVTLNSPQLGLTNVAVPCYESNELNENQLRQVANSMPQENWEQLKNAQGQVSARRELYAFPMEDGRTLILPIDAYDVQTDPNVQVW